MKSHLEKNQTIINEMIARRQERDARRRQEAERRREQGLENQASSINPSMISQSNRNCTVERMDYLHIEVVDKYEVEVQCGPQTKESAVTTQESEAIQVDLPANKENKHKKREQGKQPHEVQELQGEQLASIIQSRNFHDFFTRSSKFLQKVLDHGQGRVMETLISQSLQTNQAKQQSQVITKLLSFADPNYTTNRVVTDLDWSPQISQLFLASYSQNDEGSIKDHVGLVLLWDPSLKNRAEFCLHCQSSVTSSMFYPYSKSIVIGGCENGQIMVWDLRDKPTPSQRTAVSSNSHKYPICSLNVVGTKMASNIVSYSSDGAMCVWDLHKLSKPIKSTQLVGKRTQDSLSYFQRSRTESSHDINIKCCKFPQGDPNNYYIGSFNGAMYKTAVHNKAGEGVEMYSEHEGPISGISINSPSEYKALDNLILTSSYDWTVKLWHPDSNKSICTFQGSDDYIYDVNWHPTNPSLFATCNNEGYLDLYDLTRSLDAPVTHEKATKNAQNRCVWNREGSCIITGDSSGEISLFGLKQQYRKMERSKYQDLVDNISKKMEHQ